jgi:cytochrome b561
MRLFWLVPWPRISAIMSQPPAVKEGLHSFFFAVHRVLGYVFYVIFVLHVGATLKHQFLDKEPELQRMLPAPRRDAKT